MRFITDRKRAEGLGSARRGVEHWWEQRVSAVTLAILAPLFVLPFAYHVGDGYEEAIRAYSHPVNALIAIAFITTMFLHLYQGLQVIIEDYVHDRFWEVVLLIAARLGCALFGITGVFAILKIAIGS
ncbi:MAG: succinate dehydrogenase, hydrophobic membrane anchor protein [Alphaproteobacteria bacterium]|nr:MAG: succinate dehydrogenase, hydrophobic membrane anchor protein [Alphaproteobacteria bacterium]